MESQSTPKAESIQALRPVQLRFDPLGDIVEVDFLLSRRQPGSRPGQRRLLTERRDAMRAFAAALRPS